MNSLIKDISFISELKNLFFSNPLIAISFSICLFSMAGVPPLIGFFSKLYVLYSAIQDGYIFITLVCIIVSIISASYYLKIIKILFTRNNELKSSNLFNANKINNKVDLIVLSNFHAYLIAVLTLFILLFILKSSLILNSTQWLSLKYFFI